MNVRAPWQIAALIFSAAFVLAAMLTMPPIPNSVDMRELDLITLAALSRW